MHYLQIATASLRVRKGTARCSDRHSFVEGGACPPSKNVPHAVRVTGSLPAAKGRGVLLPHL
ncbi:hypothetical protein ABIE78_006527 [Sinorhizobium fredii]